MARRLSPERAAELDSLKRAWFQLSGYLQAQGCFESAADSLFPRDLAGQEARAPAMLLRGIREGLVDLLEMTRDFSDEQVRAADEQLASTGGPTLSELRISFWGQLPRLLARKRLRNEFEYRLLMERLNDISPQSLADEERVIASRLVSEYEERRR